MIWDTNRYISGKASQYQEQMGKIHLDTLILDLSNINVMCKNYTNNGFKTVHMYMVNLAPRE